MTVNYIISYRHTPERYKNLKRVLKWLEKIPEINVIVVEQDITRRMPKNAVTHILAYDPRDFNRAFGFNVGVKETEADIYIFGDSDLIVPDNHLIKGILSIDEEQFDVVSPYDVVYDLSPTETSLSLDKINNIVKEGRDGINLCGGISIWSSQAIYRAGLWEEDICTWGMEDNIQTLKLSRLEMSCGTINGPSFHLYHGKSPIDKNSYDKGIQIHKQLRDAPIEGLKKYLEHSLELTGNKNRFV